MKYLLTLGQNARSCLNHATENLNRSQPSISYRPDIDGLRAIAVILVLIYHAGLSLFPSGFVGVDVFFVISGFLITGIIVHSLNEEHFSFLGFYNRRLWRLQPVFLALLVLSTLVTLVFFLPDDLTQYTRSLRKASLFMSHVFFSNTTTGYFSPDVHQLPLLHTWSLGVEWQCYFILPGLMYGLHRLVKPHLFFTVLILTLLFLVLTFYYSNSEPVKTYYQLSSRFFEFLVGSSIALMPMRARTLTPYLINTVGFLALGCIFFIAKMDNILIGYPNAYALLVCCMTGLLIRLGTRYPHATIIRTLSVKPLVFIGVLSYSLYLWHWVVLSLMNYQGTAPTGWALLFAMSITFVLAYCSWQWIEKPSRVMKNTPFRYTFVFLLLLPILIIHSLDLLVKKQNGFPQRFNDELVTIYKELNRYSHNNRSLCISHQQKNSEQVCRIGSEIPKSKTALMIGDSFSNHYWGFMDVLGKASQVSILAQGTSSCITLPGIYLYDWWHFKNQVYQECYDETTRYFQMIEKNHYDYVIIGQIWANYLSNHVVTNPKDKRSMRLAKNRLEQALNQALKIITTSGARPVLIKSTAVMQENVHDCFFKHIKLRKPYAQEECRFALSYSEEEAWFDRLFDKMQKRYPKLIIINPKQVQCQANQCAASLNGVPMYRDVGHLTDYASYQLGHLYLQHYGNPLKT